MNLSTIMSSPVADQYQVDEFNYGPPPSPYFTGPAARQIQNPQHIFMNYPPPVPLRFGSAFQPLQARDGCPDIDLMALHPAPQASTPGMHPTSNCCFQAGNQEPDEMQNMHSLPVGAGFNGYYQPLPNAWYPQPSPNVAGAAFQGMPAGQASYQVPPQFPQAYGSIAVDPSLEMLGNQTPQPFVDVNGAAPWGTFVGQTPHGSYQPSANMAMTAPQHSLVSQPFVHTTGPAPQVTPQAFQPSVNNTGAASWETQVDQTPHQSHRLSTNIPSAAAQAPPQTFQSSTNVTETAPRGTLGDQTPHGTHQPSTNTAATGPQKSTDCQPSKPIVENAEAAHRGTLGSQSSDENNQSFTNRAIAALQQILDNQSPRRSVNATGTVPQGESASQASDGSHQASTNVAVPASQESPVSQISQPVADTTGAAPQGESVSQASLGSHQPSTNTAVTAPQNSPVNQPSRPVTASQGRSVGRNGLEVHSRIHGSRVNGVRRSTTTQSPTTSRGLRMSEKKNLSPKKTQPQKSCPPPPLPEDMRKQDQCTSWETDMARYLHNDNVMGLYKVGDNLCDVHAASGELVKLAKRDATPDGECFWRHIILGQRIHSIDPEYLNGRIACLSDGTFIGMEDSQGNMIVPKWQFTDPVILESKSEEPKDRSEFEELKDQNESKELEDQSESKGLAFQRGFWKLRETLKKRAITLKKKTAAISGLKPGCDPMWF